MTSLLTTHTHTHTYTHNNNNKNKAGRRKVWEVMNMFMALVVEMVSWYMLLCKVVELYTLCIYSFLCINHTSIMWF